MKNIKQKSGVAYIRESTEEQDKGFSPQNQERSIKEYAKTNNINIVEVYKDLLSGTSADKRNDFQKMIKDAEQKKFDIILVYHTSRFARNIQEARKYKEYLREQLNIDVTSITQNFGNWNDPGSFLNEGINELFDAHYSKQLSFWMRSAFQEKRKQGYQLGNPPFGYTKKKLGFDKERNRTIYSKNWEIDKNEAKIIKRFFSLYASGNYSYADLAAKIDTQGIKTKYNHPFTYSSIKDILKNKTYLGYIYSPRRNYPLLPGKHKPIISDELFEIVQEKINERRGTKGRPVAQHRFYLLQGLVYCYHCYKHIIGKENDINAKMSPKMYCVTLSVNRKEYLTYGCKFRRENKSCKQENVRCEVIDNQVIKYMEGFNLPNDIIQMTLDKLKERFKKTKESPDYVTRIKFLENKKRKLTFRYENTDDLADEQYLNQLNDIKRELKEYEKFGLIKNSPKANENECLKETEEFLRNFKNLWHNLDPEERKQWIQMVIKRVWIKDKKVAAIEPKDDYKPLFSSHKKVLGQSPLITP